MSRIVRGCLGAVAGAAVGGFLAWLARELPPLNGSHPQGAAEWLFVVTLTGLEGFSLGTWRGAMQLMVVQAGMVHPIEELPPSPDFLKPHVPEESTISGLPRLVTAVLAAVEGASVGLFVGWFISLLIQPPIIPPIYLPVCCASAASLLWLATALWGTRNMARFMAAMDAAEDGVPFEQPQKPLQSSASAQPVQPSNDGSPASGARP